MSQMSLNDNDVELQGAIKRTHHEIRSLNSTFFRTRIHVSSHVSDARRSRLNSTIHSYSRYRLQSPLRVIFIRCECKTVHKMWTLINVDPIYLLDSPPEVLQQNKYIFYLFRSERAPPNIVNGVCRLLFIIIKEIHSHEVLHLEIYS